MFNRRYLHRREILKGSQRTQDAKKSNNTEIITRITTVRKIMRKIMRRAEVNVGCITGSVVVRDYDCWEEYRRAEVDVRCIKGIVVVSHLSAAL